MSGREKKKWYGSLKAFLSRPPHHQENIEMEEDIRATDIHNSISCIDYLQICIQYYIFFILKFKEIFKFLHSRSASNHIDKLNKKILITFYLWNKLTLRTLLNNKHASMRKWIKLEMYLSKIEGSYLPFNY